MTKEFKYQTSWLKDRFYDTNLITYLETRKDSEMLNVCFMDDEELKTEKQRKAVHGLMLELWKSGETSFKSYDELRNHFKESAGLIVYDKSFMDKEMHAIQLKVYDMLPTKELKDKHSRTILMGQRIIKSYSDATKEESSLMMKEVINYCYKIGLNTWKFQDIMKGLEK